MKEETFNNKEDPFDPIDALGNEIKINSCYGYSVASGGTARTVIGKAVKFTATGSVRLEILEVKNFLYGRPYERTCGENASHVNMRPHMLFPVEWRTT